MKPNAESIINLSVKSNGELDLFLYLKKGNGIDLFTKLLLIDTLTLSTREGGSRYDKYIDLKGTFEGFYIEVTFLNEVGNDY